MTLFLAGAIAAHWGELHTAEQAIFTALLGLAVYMVRRGLLAHGLLVGRAGNWRLAYVEHSGRRQRLTKLDEVADLAPGHRELLWSGGADARR